MTSTRLKWPAAYHVALSDDDEMVACVGRSVKVIDMKDRVRLSASRPLSHPSSASFSPNGKILAVKSTSGKIVTIDPRTGGLVMDFENQREGEGCGIFFSPDGSELIDGSWDGDLTIRNSADGAISFRDHYAGEMLSRISHDRQRRLWLVEHSPVVKAGENQAPPNYISLHHWPIAEGKAQAFTFDMHIESVQIAPDGMRFCFFQKSDSRRLHVARVSDGQIIASSPEIARSGTGSELAWSEDGKYVAAAADNQFVFMRASDLTIVGTKPIEYSASVAFTHNSGELVLGTWKTSTVEKFDSLIES